MFLRLLCWLASLFRRRRKTIADVPVSIDVQVGGR